MKKIHVVPMKNGRWRVEREGATRAISTHRLQSAATRRARALAKHNRVELLVHNRHGKIVARDSFGHDPFPPRG